MRELILGGVRSGKSRLAAARAEESGLSVTIIATAVAGDDEEMRQRIAAHRAARPSDWSVIEEPYALARRLRENASPDRCIVVECLTLWLTNLLCRGGEAVEEEREALLAAIPALPGKLILVSNETGLGVHPVGELVRRFCDEAGITHQRLVPLCDRVVLTIAGLVLTLKGQDS